MPLRYQVHISCVSQYDTGVDMIRDMRFVSDVSSFYFLWYHDGIMFSKRRVISSYIMSCICIMNISIYHVSTRDMIHMIQDDDTHDTQWYNQDIWWYIMISCIENSLFLYWKLPQSRADGPQEKQSSLHPLRPIAAGTAEVSRDLHPVKWRVNECVKLKVLISTCCKRQTGDTNAATHCRPRHHTMNSNARSWWFGLVRSHLTHTSLDSYWTLTGRPQSRTTFINS